MHVTREQMREMDRIAIENYQIPGIILMENAGAGASRIIMEKFSPGPIAIFCGKGNNGGDGFVIARHLYNHGFDVKIFFLGNLSQVVPDSDPGIHLRILQKMKITPVEIQTVSQIKAYSSEIQKCQAMVDAIFGTGLKGPIQQPILGIMQEIASWNKPMIAIDIPSGLDCNTGEILNVCLRASFTITFGFPKKGFLCGKGPEMTGEVMIVDISLPRDIVERFRS